MIAHALSASRLLLVAPLVVLILRGDAFAAGIAALLFVIAIVTDLLDGRIARRQGTESALGRALDHGADFAFVCSGLFAGAARGLLPWLLPILIALAFVQYVADSRWGHRQRELRMSALGRWNGVLYFVPLGGVILVDLGLEFLRSPTVWVAWALIASTLLSIGDRLLALRAPDRTARGSRGAGR